MLKNLIPKIFNISSRLTCIIKFILQGRSNATNNNQTSLENWISVSYCHNVVVNETLPECSSLLYYFDHEDLEEAFLALIL